MTSVQLEICIFMRTASNAFGSTLHQNSSQANVNLQDGEQIADYVQNIMQN